MKQLRASRCTLHAEYSRKPKAQSQIQEYSYTPHAAWGIQPKVESRKPKAEIQVKAKSGKQLQVQLKA
jgi:hypothetical protein